MLKIDRDVKRRNSIEMERSGSVRGWANCGDEPQNWAQAKPAAPGDDGKADCGCQWQGQMPMWPTAASCVCVCVCVCVLFLKRKGYGTEVSPTHTHTTQSVNVSALNSSRYACCVILSAISITLSINVMQKGVHTHCAWRDKKERERVTEGWRVYLR